MIKKVLPWKTLSFILLLFINIIFVFPASVHAAWYFNWSCGSPIGSPGGTQGPYADKSACESDLGRARSACESAGGSFSGWCRGSDDYSPAPGYREHPGPDWGEIQRRQREAERRRMEEERLRREAEEEARRREEEAKKNFERSKQEALELMKGTGSDTLTIKSGAEFFGIKGTPEKGLTIKSGMPEEAVNKAAMAWACATWIADFVFPAARKGDISEVRFLEEQTKKALSGETPGVDCPKISPPPDVHGIAIGPDSSGFKFYNALLKAVSIQSEQLIQATQTIVQFFSKEQVTDEDIKKLEQELKSQEKTGTTDETKKDDEDPLAEALAALNKAQEAKKKIDEYEAMHEKVQANPSVAEKLIGKIEN